MKLIRHIFPAGRQHIYTWVKIKMNIITVPRPEEVHLPRVAYFMKHGTLWNPGPNHQYTVNTLCSRTLSQGLKRSGVSHYCFENCHYCWWWCCGCCRCCCCRRCCCCGCQVISDGTGVVEL